MLGLIYDDIRASGCDETTNKFERKNTTRKESKGVQNVRSIIYTHAPENPRNPPKTC